MSVRSVGTERLSFNPCKGFRCFEAEGIADGATKVAVSIPVRVLDVLKPLNTECSTISPPRFNPCKGFRCFEAAKQEKNYDPITRFNPCKGFRCFEAPKIRQIALDRELAKGFNPCKGFRCFEAKNHNPRGLKTLVSIPVRVLDVLKPARKPLGVSFQGFNPCKGFRCFEAILISSFRSTDSRFNPCKGFRCFEASEQYQSLSQKLIGFNPCKGFRCFEASVHQISVFYRCKVSIPVRVLDVLKLEAIAPICPMFSVSIPVRVLDVLKQQMQGLMHPPQSLFQSL